MIPDESPTTPPAPRTFAERLFTPENVRILQSLGIGIIFISAIALVRNQMWSGASNMQRLGMLIGGTAICYTIGGLLYKWTSLRITGLGFLILGHLAIILDAYAALILPDSGQRLYPFAPASLWAFTFLLFTITAFFHARALKEPLFDAFTLFGALAAWASGALWADISVWLVPAAFVPALFIARGLAFALRRMGWSGAAVHGTTDEQTYRRWSLGWWLRSCWISGSKFLGVILIGSALGSAYLYHAPGTQSELALKFSYHAAAIAALGIGLLTQSGSGIGSAQFGSLLLLILAPLAAFAFGLKFDRYPLALSAPGAALALAALAIRALFARAESDLRARCETVSDWGLGAAIIGGSWAAGYFFGSASPLPIWSALCMTIASVAYALVRRVPVAAWLTTGASAFLALTVIDRAGLSSDAYPLALLIGAAVLLVLWHLAGRAESFRETGRHGGWAAESLALCAIATLVTKSGALIGLTKPADLSLAGDWAAAALFLLLSARLTGCELRRSFGLGLLSPALACALYYFKFEVGAAAPALAMLALAIYGVEQWMNRKASIRTVLLPGAGMIVVHALVLAGWQYGNGENASAAIAFALLAGLGVSLSIQARVFHMSSATLAEVSTLGLVALAWLNFCALLGVCGAAWASALTLLAAMTLLLSLLAESVAGVIIVALHPDEKLDAVADRPFHLAGGMVAMVLCGLTLGQLFMNHTHQSHIWFINNAWTTALLAAYIAVRPTFSRKGEANSPLEMWIGTLTGILSVLLFAMASLRTVSVNFWLPTCRPNVREACAVFFGATLTISALSGYWARRVFSPITGMLAALGLVGCAYGEWKLPVESFGLACATLAAIGVGISLRMRHTEKLLRSGLLWAMEFSAGSVALSAGLYMVFGLAGWKVGQPHAYSVAGWLVLAGIAGLSAPGGLSAWRTFAAAIAMGFASCHVMRWMGLGFDHFGPALAACALLALAIRELIFIAPRDLEDSQAQRSAAGAGLSLASLPLALAGLAFGAWGRMRGDEWLWCATLAECALFLAMHAVTLRRGEKVRFVRVVGCELGAWLLLALAVNAASHALSMPLVGAGWALLGAIFLALGMAGESIAGALLGAERHSRTPTPFLESRHLAAAALAFFGVLQVMYVASPLDKFHIDATWRAMFGASAVAIYLSLSAWSLSENFRNVGRVAASFAAYIILIPLTYLCFLKAHSTGSSWGALWFMLLAPVMYGAVYVLEREKQELQASMAKFGIAIVNLGALVLAYAGNGAHLAAVPAATLALIAVQAALARRLTGERGMTWVACVSSTVSVFYALRTVMNVPAWGEIEPCVFEMPALSAWALAMVTLGGALKLDEDETGISRVAQCGAWISAAALFDAVLSILLRGPNVHTMPGTHLLRLDALIMCLLFLAGTAISARRWMRFEAGRYIAPVATLLGYAMFILKEPVTNWEWITMPVAVFLFLWARQQADEEGNSETEVGILLSLASSFALVPSFVQAIPYGSTAALWHAAVMLAAGMAMVMCAMFARRKIPLLAGSGSMLLLTLIKTLQWAAHRELFLPLVGIAVGFAILAMGSVFEARMNRLIRETLGRAKAEARMFWVSWN